MDYQTALPKSSKCFSAEFIIRSIDDSRDPQIGLFLPAPSLNQLRHIAKVSNDLNLARNQLKINKTFKILQNCVQHF